MKKQKLITVKLTDLIGMNVRGLMAQITNPIYLRESSHPSLEDAWSQPRWRKLEEVRTYKESGKKWVELIWEKAEDDVCNNTGSTIERDACSIQFTKEEYAKIGYDH